MVNTEQENDFVVDQLHYNILNIVVNTEHLSYTSPAERNYNILNIVVNTELNGIPVKLNI